MRLGGVVEAEFLRGDAELSELDVGHEPAPHQVLPQQVGADPACGGGLVLTFDGTPHRRGPEERGTKTRGHPGDGAADLERVADIAEAWVPAEEFIAAEAGERHDGAGIADRARNDEGVEAVNGGLIERGEPGDYLCARGVGADLDVGVPDVERACGLRGDGGFAEVGVIVEADGEG